MKKLITIALLAFIGQTASAQFGNLLNRVKSSAKSSVENAIVNEANKAGRDAVKASVNKHQELQIVGSGTVMYIYIIGGGWDTHQRSVELIREPGHLQYQVFNCPSLYTGCRQIQGEWGGLE